MPLQRPETELVAAADVTFHGPAADYLGRPEAARILAHISAVVDDVWWNAS